MKPKENLFENFCSIAFAMQKTQTARERYKNHPNIFHHCICNDIPENQTNLYYDYEQHGASS